MIPYMDLLRHHYPHMKQLTMAMLCTTPGTSAEGAFGTAEKRVRIYLADDKVESDSMDLLHHMWKLMLKGKLCAAPIDNPRGGVLWCSRMVPL